MYLPAQPIPFSHKVPKSVRSEAKIKNPEISYDALEYDHTYAMKCQCIEKM